jgi:hypothetical protein
MASLRRFFAAAVLPILGMIVVAAASPAQADIQMIVILTDSQIYNGDTANPDYSQMFNVQGTGIQSASVRTPGGTDITLPVNQNSTFEFKDDSFTDLSSLRALYPLGTYDFTITNSNLSTDTVSLLFNPQDSGTFIVPTSPAPGATDVSASPPPTFLWTSGSGTALGCELRVHNGNDVDRAEPPYDISHTSWTPAVGLAPYTNYDFALSLYQQGSASFDQETAGQDPFTYYGVFGHTNVSQFTTAPEPGTLALLTAGVLALFAWRPIRRKVSPGVKRLG